jgi:hypothetical protein
LNKLLIFVFLLACFGCQENRAPKDALERYIELRLKGSTDKDDYFEVVEGELKSLIESLNEEEFKDFVASMDGVKKRNLNILHSTCGDKRCHFTYVISLAHKQEEKTLYHADVKKVALIEKFEESWKLTDIVSEPKTFLKGIDPITPDDFSKKFGVDPDNVKLDRGGRALRDKKGNFQTK